MVDVIHYYFETDARYSSADEAEAVSRLRSSLYSMYGQTYRYGVSGSAKNSGGRSYVSASDDDLLPDEFSPKVSKSYVPATDVDPEAYLPFGPALDAPIGG